MRLEPEGGQKLTDFRFGESGTYRGPIIGLDNEKVYVLWAVQSLGGGFAPSAADTFYVSFEPGRPSLTNADVVTLPPDSAPIYGHHAAPYGYSELARLGSQVAGSDFVNAPSTIYTQAGELPVSLSLVVRSSARVLRSPQAEELRFEDSVALTTSGMQLALVVFSGGRPIGYQLIGNTPGASVLSTLAADDAANLHVAWIDTAGFRQYNVYYATTCPEGKKWLDRTTVDDVAFGVGALLWGVLSGVGLVPIIAMWNLAPAMWMVVFYLASGHEDLELIGAKIGLIVAIVLYTTVKLLFLPGLSAVTPSLGWLPTLVASILAAARPGIILAFAIAAIYLYGQRSVRGTMFKAYLVFAATDGLLTAVLYAPGFSNPR